MSRKIIERNYQSPFGRWWLAAALDIQDRLISALNVKRVHLTQYANGRRKFSANRAGDISAIMLDLAKVGSDVPRPLTRGDLCETCRKCEYYINGEALDTDDLK